MKVIIFTNDSRMLWNFREPFLLELIRRNNKLKIYCNKNETINSIEHVNSRFCFNTTSPKDLLVDCWKYSKIIAKEKPDFVINYTVRNCVIGSVYQLASNSKVKTIFFIAGLGRFYKKGAFTSKLLLHLIKNRGSNRWNKIITLNNRDFNALCTRNTVRIESEGINLSKFHFDKKNIQRSKILFLGRIIPEKGIMEVLQLSKILYRFDPKLSIELYGDDSNSDDKLKSLINQGVNVKYNGMVEDVRPLIQQSDLLILPSRLNEGYPRVILEAFAIGRPVFVFDTPGCKDSYLDLGLISKFVSKDVNEMANQIINYYKQTDNYKSELSENLRNYVENKHEIGDVTQRLIDLIDEFK